MAKIKKRGPKSPPRMRRKALAPDKTREAVLRQQLAQARAPQAATAEILRAISRSRTDEQPAFREIVKNAHRLCGAPFSILYRYDGKMLHIAADSQPNSRASAVLRTL